jgi:hypothetical protein
MEAISDPATGGQGNFILGRIMNQVTRSSYGQRLATNMTRDIPRARTLAGQNGTPKNYIAHFNALTNLQLMSPPSVPLMSALQKRAPAN